MMINYLTGLGRLKTSLGTMTGPMLAPRKNEIKPEGVDLPIHLGVQLFDLKDDLELMKKGLEKLLSDNSRLSRELQDARKDIQSIRMGLRL